MALCIISTAFSIVLKQAWGSAFTGTRFPNVLTYSHPAQTFRMVFFSERAWPYPYGRMFSHPANIFCMVFVFRKGHGPLHNLDGAQHSPQASLGLCLHWHEISQQIIDRAYFLYPFVERKSVHSVCGENKKRQQPIG